MLQKNLFSPNCGHFPFSFDLAQFIIGSSDGKSSGHDHKQRPLVVANENVKARKVKN